jgi:cis-3-alkyl-4-acyloxetan-2-one decarboxylase
MPITPWREFRPFRFSHPHGFTQAGWDVSPANPKSTLVFIHGNPSNKALFRHLMEAASADYRCIAIDHIGMGESDKPDAGAYDFHFETRVDDLARTLDQLKAGNQLTLVMHDWGGIIGLRYAQRHPERVARLVITNTAAFPLLPHKKLPKEIWFVRNTWLGGVACKYFNAFQRGAVARGVMGTMSDADAKLYTQHHTNAHDCEAILRFVRDIPLGPKDRGYDTLVALQPFFAELAKLPTQIFWGLKDFAFDADYLAEFQRLLPQAGVFKYPNAGHWLTEDAHADMIPRLLEFLQRTDAQVKAS